jgi:hypothetical protein
MSAGENDGAHPLVASQTSSPDLPDPDDRTLMAATYMVETYVAAEPPTGWRIAAEHAHAAARIASEEGVTIRHLRSIYVPADEMCHHLFEGSSLEAVQVASERAGIRFERIVAVEQVEPADESVSTQGDDR